MSPNKRGRKRARSEPVEVEEKQDEKVGRCSEEERKKKVARYLAKRPLRNFQKTINYPSRKTLADSRPRVKGQFATNGDNETNMEMEPVPTDQVKTDKGKKPAVELEEQEEEETGTYAGLLFKPPHGPEVYIGRIPADSTADELRDFCKAAGQVLEVKILRKDDEKEAYAFASISFVTVEMASKAINELDNTEFKGKKVRCAMSKFAMNIPSQWEESELKNVHDQPGHSNSTEDIFAGLEKITETNEELVWGTFGVTPTDSSNIIVWPIDDSLEIGGPLVQPPDGYNMVPDNPDGEDLNSGR